MKKLKLKALEFGAKEVLTREQLKRVLGGDGSGDGNDVYLDGGDSGGFASCTVTCHCTSTVTNRGICKSNPCSATDDVGVQCGSTYYSCSTICIM
ncbi:hypothetical protein ACI6Q2_19640 [Chitinophagaceae bacterium LWZ2-11]